MSSNKIKYYILVTTFLLSCNIYKNNNKISSGEIDQTFYQDTIDPNFGKLILKDSIIYVTVLDSLCKNKGIVDCESMRKLKIIVFYSIIYHIGLDKDNVIRMIEIWDKNFATPEGIKIGTPISEIDSNYICFISRNIYTMEYEYMILKSGYGLFYIPEDENSKVNSTVIYLAKAPPFFECDRKLQDHYKKKINE
jgi:hypothetical protein